jgi:hypothetical protein
MTTLVFAAVLLLQGSTCTGDAAALLPSAAQRAAAFELADAATRVQAAVKAQCPGAVVASAYTRGLIAARAAYRTGGSPDALAPVWEAIAIIKAESRSSNDLAAIAVFVLQAAVAAAQSERDDLSLMIEHAVQLEGIRMSAGLPGLPMVTAHEVAGELWFQVYRYDEARKAYEGASSRVGFTPRVTLGLARVAARLDATTTACTQYRKLVESWTTAAGNPPEIAEARAFLSGPACGGATTPR